MLSVYAPMVRSYGTYIIPLRCVMQLRFRQDCSFVLGCGGGAYW